MAKSFLKWAGGKGQLIKELKGFMPSETFTRYAEPFIGGGSFLIYILSKFEKVKDVYLSDVNADLINCYIHIRDNVDSLIDVLNSLECDCITRPTKDQESFYYQVRLEFNKYCMLDKDDSNRTSVYRAAQFIFLNKTCFNGVYRVNSKGELNIPFCGVLNKSLFDFQNLVFLSRLFSGVEMVCDNYKSSYDFISKNSTFAYFDPPYKPLSTSSSFNSYNESGFNDSDQLELVEFLKSIDNKCLFMVSNSDPFTANGDRFFEDAYSCFNINRIQASRMLNSKGDSRGPIGEIVVTNYSSFLTNGDELIDDVL